jgi:hypothetical protein
MISVCVCACSAAWLLHLGWGVGVPVHTCMVLAADGFTWSMATASFCTHLSDCRVCVCLQTTITLCGCCNMQP